MKSIRYAGEWVVMCEGKMIAHDKDLTKIADIIDDCRRPPTIFRVPESEICLY